MKTSYILLRACAFVLGTAGLASAQNPDLSSLAERLKNVETQMDTLRRENLGLRQQLGYDAGGKSPVATWVQAQGKAPKLSVGGFFQANSEFGDAPDSRFSPVDRIMLRRARLGAKGMFAEQFDFTFQSDFGNNSIGGVSGYRAQLTDCFVVWNRYPAANISLGQFKTPYGYEQLVADPKNITVERSLPNDQLTLSRQLGAMVSGSFFKNSLGYSAGMFNGNGANNGSNDNDQFLYVGRLTSMIITTDRSRVGVGVGGFSTRDTGTFMGRRTGLGIDAQAGYGAYDVQAELLRTNFDRDVGADYTANGWSVLGACMFVPKKLQGIVRYETYDPNRSVAANHSNLWTVGFNYFIKGDDLKLSVNYLIGDPAGPLSNQARLLTRMQVVF
jgi:phosphate-selective porin OprO and OprP